MADFGVGAPLSDFTIGVSTIGNPFASGLLGSGIPQRTYGRVTNPDGSQTWQMIQADPSGNFDYGYITTLVQCLKLNLGESPFYANYGIPAQPSIMQQIFPDYYVNQIQQQFAQFFSSLVITKVNSRTPTYNVNITTLQGTVVRFTIPV